MLPLNIIFIWIDTLFDEDDDDDIDEADMDRQDETMRSRSVMQYTVES